MTEREKEDYKENRQLIAMANLNGFLSNIDLRKSSLTLQDIQDLVESSFNVAESFLTVLQERDAFVDSLFDQDEK